MPPSSPAFFHDVVVKGALASSGMPPFEALTADEERALYAFLINGAWEAYEHDQKLRSATKTR
jgi:hypothetical protein